MFQKFLNNLKTTKNSNLIESIKLGYQICFEHIDISQHETIIKEGTILYHGTGESFDVRKIRTGGYDNILWTTDNVKIAKYYIPLIGGYIMNVNLDRNIVQPFLKKEEPWYSIISKQLGITEEIKKFLIEKAIKKNEENSKWYKKVEECKKIEHILDKKEDIAYKDKTNLDEIILERDKNIKNWEIAETELNKSPFIKYTYFLSKYIISKMEKILNYKLTTNLGDETYKKIIIIDNELMPADYQLQGTVVILKPKRDLKLYNYAYGRSEGDLMNVDYHKIDLFRKIEKNGYDGVVIHDFAQSNYWGNIGHIAYGLFPNTIKDLNISSIKKQTHPINENQTEEKNKTIVLYRGEYTGNIGGQFYSPDKEWARQFTQSGLDREIKTIKIKESDIYNSTAYAGDPDEVHAAIAKARAAGKRAVRLDEGHGQPKSVKIFDPSILQNTTKQSPISKPVSFARWLQSAVDTRGLVGAHKTEQTMAGTVDDWLLHPSLREQFKEQLELPVIIDPKLKMTILGIARKNQGNLGRHVVISPRANEEVFIHELIHHKNPALSEDEVKAKGSELLPNLYKQSL